MPPNNISQTYLNQSCDGCRSKRKKCDRKQPSCTECLKRGLQCEASHKLSCRSGCNSRVAKIEFDVQGLDRKVKEQKKELEERTRELDETRSKLDETKRELEERMRELEERTRELEEMVKERDEMRNIVHEMNHILSVKNGILNQALSKDYSTSVLTGSSMGEDIGWCSIDMTLADTLMFKGIIGRDTECFTITPESARTAGNPQYLTMDDPLHDLSEILYSETMGEYVTDDLLRSKGHPEELRIIGDPCYYHPETSHDGLSQIGLSELGEVRREGLMFEKNEWLEELIEYTQGAV